MSASTCPYCGAETRPGDNFCLNCGNRLLPSTPSPQQAQPAMGESTIPAQEGWGQGVPGPGSAPGAAGGWAGAGAPTVAGSQMEPPTVRGDAQQAQAAAPMAAQAPASVIDRPARFTLRAENGDVIQEYPLEKPEVSIGRAPNSDILLSKDKLTSRRHATVRYEDGKYVLYDERSANGTFVNGEQLEEMVPHALQDGDHVGIGEHELIFHAVDASQSADNNVADMPTISVPYNPGQEVTYRTREDESLTAASNDDFSTKSMENGTADVAQPSQPGGVPAAQVGASPAPVAEDVPVPASVTPPVSTSAPGTSSASEPPAPAPQPSPNGAVTFNRLGEIPQPGMPDIAPLMARSCRCKSS
jgi:hypothetical protein